jgi:hypothetical protein
MTLAKDRNEPMNEYDMAFLSESIWHGIEDRDYGATRICVNPGDMALLPAEPRVGLLPFEASDDVPSGEMFAKNAAGEIVYRTRYYKSESFKQAFPDA